MERSQVLDSVQCPRSGVKSRWRGVKGESGRPEIIDVPFVKRAVWHNLPLRSVALIAEINKLKLGVCPFFSFFSAWNKDAVQRERAMFKVNILNGPQSRAETV